MGYEGLSGPLIGPLDRSLIYELDKASLDRLTGLRRRIDSELQDRRRQRADGRGDQRIPCDEVRIRAQQANIGQRVA